MKDNKAVEFVLGFLTILGVIATIGAGIAFVGLCAGFGWRLAFGC